MSRSVVLDTETTGFSYDNGDRLIEIGLVEMLERKATGRVFHKYVDPGFEIPEEATKVHGLTREDVIHLGGGQTFKDIAEEMLVFINGDELVIHNAGFDMGFLDKELAALGLGTLSSRCKVFDTLRFAGLKFPGARNNLDALCKRYGIDTSERTAHGALLDATLLAEVYLQLTREQNRLNLDGRAVDPTQANENLIARIERVDGLGLPVVTASAAELLEHNGFLERLAKKSKNAPHWSPVEMPEVAAAQAPSVCASAPAKPEPRSERRRSMAPF